MIALVGARVRRVDRPTPELVTLEIAAGARAVLVISAAAAAPGLGLVPDRPRGRPIDAFGGLLRKHLESSTIVSVEAGAAGARVVFVEASGERAIVLEALHGREGRGFRLRDPDAQAETAALGQSARALPVLPDLPAVDDAELEARGPGVLAAHARAAFEARTRAARLAIARAIEKIERKLAAIARDAARSESAAPMRHEADLLSAFAADDRAGRAAIVVDDWASDPPASRTIALDPTIGPRTNAARRYHQAKRLERGMAIAHERSAAAAATLAPWRALEAALAIAHDDTSLAAIEAALEARGATRVPVGPAKHERPTHCPYREFASARGIAIRVGKNAADNDELTVRIARPHHVFLHARGVAGSHVIVALAKNTTCDEATLVDAATLAAHFSSARGEPVVEVQYVARRHVRKPRGSARGAVQVDREKVMLLRLEPERLRRLLEAERRPTPG